MCTQSNEAYNAVKKSRETDDDYEAVVEQYPLPTPSLPLHTTTTATVDTLYEKI